MNGYDLSRTFFEFSFENPEKINPNHVAIYFFAIEHCNMLGWKEKFGFPAQMAMEAIGVKKHHTYKKYFDDLVEWGFFKVVQESKNQYSANIISLNSAMPKNGKALGKANQRHGAKHGAKQSESTGQSTGRIDKPLNNEPLNQKPLNNKENFPSDIHAGVFDRFRVYYPGTKRGNETEFAELKKHKDWKQVLPNLFATLEKHIVARKEKAKAGQFVPEWKNLKTWIHGRCWEEEIWTPPKKEKPNPRNYYCNEWARYRDDCIAAGYEPDKHEFDYAGPETLKAV